MLNIIYVCDQICEKCLRHTIVNIKKSHFEILNTVYLESACCLIYTTLHKSIVIQDNSICILLNGLLAELSAILDCSLPVPQVIT